MIWFCSYINYNPAIIMSISNTFHLWKIESISYSCINIWTIYSIPYTQHTHYLTRCFIQKIAASLYKVKYIQQTYNYFVDDRCFLQCHSWTKINFNLELIFDWTIYMICVGTILQYDSNNRNEYKMANITFKVHRI